MTTFLRFCAFWLVLGLAAVGTSDAGRAQSGEARFALIVGNDGYQVPVPSAANDALATRSSSA